MSSQFGLHWCTRTQPNKQTTQTADGAHPVRLLLRGRHGWHRRRASQCPGRENPSSRRCAGRFDLAAASDPRTDRRRRRHEPMRRRQLGLRARWRPARHLRRCVRADRRQSEATRMRRQLPPKGTGTSAGFL
jgi:hypothetical protein